MIYHWNYFWLLFFFDIWHYSFLRLFVSFFLLFVCFLFVFLSIVNCCKVIFFDHCLFLFISEGLFKSKVFEIKYWRFIEFSEHVKKFRIILNSDTTPLHPLCIKRKPWMFVRMMHDWVLILATHSKNIPPSFCSIFCPISLT